jgi:hypothetical protein
MSTPLVSDADVESAMQEMTDCDDGTLLALAENPSGDPPVRVAALRLLRGRPSPESVAFLDEFDERPATDRMWWLPRLLCDLAFRLTRLALALSGDRVEIGIAVSRRSSPWPRKWTRVRRST